MSQFISSENLHPNVESTPIFFYLGSFVQAFVIAFSFGMGAIPWLMMSEVQYLSIWFELCLLVKFLPPGF
jgi:hypothetical protein